MPTRAQDANGNVVVWNGSAWVPEGQAAQPMETVTIGTPNPLRQREQALGIDNTASTIASRQAADARAAAEAARQAALAPYQQRAAVANAAKAELEAAAAAAATGGNNNPRSGRLNALINQINHVQQLFDNGPGGTTGLAGLYDLLPVDQNARFDAAGAALVGQAFQAFRTPGEGPQSDADLRLFAEGNRPYASVLDGVNIERLNALRGRVDAELAAMGAPPANWTGSVGVQQRDQRDAALAVAPGGSPNGNAAPNGPTVLPTAAGAQGDAGINAAGVTGQGGYVPLPELASLPNEVKTLIRSGATLEQVMAHLQSRYAGASVQGIDPNVHRDNIAFAIAQHRADPRRPVGDILQGWANLGMVPARNTGTIIGQVADTGIGAGIISAANAVSGGNLGNIAGDNARSVLQFGREERPIASLAGDIGGSALAMYGVNRGAGALGGVVGRTLQGGGGLVGDAAYGAVRGGSETQGGIGDRIGGALLGAGATAAGSGLGQAVTRGLGGVVQGVNNPAASVLRNAGIPLTAGQVLGNRGMFGRTMNRLESLPVVGDMMAGQRAAQAPAYVRAQINENLSPIGATVPQGGAQDMIAGAQQAVDNSYGFLANRRFTPDQPFITDMQAAMQAGRSIPRAGEDFGTIIDRQLVPLHGPSGELSGQAYQAALQTLRGSRATLGRGDAMGAMAADELDNVAAAYRGLVQRQAPDVLDQLDNANAAYSGLVPIENASISAANGANGAGVFSPAQYGRAATTNRVRFGGRSAAARGDIPGGELQRAAQEVLPSTVPDSGTAGRALTAMLPFALPGAATLGSGYSASQGDYTTAAGLAALAAATGTRTGNRAITSALMDRPDVVRRAGRAIRSQQRRVGMFGGGAGAALNGMVIMPMLADQ